MDYLCAAYDIFFICNPTRRVHACLALTCHLHCWQTGWDHSGNTAGGTDTDTGQQLDPGEENDPASSAVWTGAQDGRLDHDSDAVP